MADGEFRELFARAGCQGWLCVREVDGDLEVTDGADELVATASVFKVAVALEVFRQASAGRLDPRERLLVGPEGRTPGPTGLSVFADEAELSVRDLVTMMLTVSDNAATDVLIDRVGLDRLHATLADLGLPRTVIPATLQQELDSIAWEAGFGGGRNWRRRMYRLTWSSGCRSACSGPPRWTRGGVSAVPRARRRRCCGLSGETRRVRPTRARRCGRPWLDK